MIFANMYKENRNAVERALRAMWCGEAGNESQNTYAAQLREVIKDLFAPQKAVPVVQCMNSYQSVHSVSGEVARATVGTLWDKPKQKSYDPYEHQYQCWKTLLEDKSEDGKPMSICVTTGTGSGKTECFMMPLVHDLEGHNVHDQIQALFLYPLNALMEDQKERLEELLEGTHLTYTVYNGDLPEDEPAPNSHSEEANRLRRRIDQIRGGYDVKDENGNVIDHKYRFPKMLYTRKMVRKNPPNILLTNPTMLEYILLRKKDEKLTNPELKSLKWIAIDETHTYTGAGAAELAMLLRRVLLAFGVDATDIHFATSSATFGNGADPEREEDQLRDFISGITGTKKNQVRVIGGKRVGEGCIPEGEDHEKWDKLFRNEFVSLDDLIEGNTSIEEKLAELDKMCERVPVVNDVPMMKAKVHYFYRVPNNGLYVKLSEHEDGAFKIYSLNNIEDKDEDEVPLLELSRCKHCGEYVALAKVNMQPGDNFGKYEALDRDDSDMFDLEETDDDAEMKYVIIGLTKEGVSGGDNNQAFNVLNGKLLSVADSDVEGEWHLIGNTHCCCPHCNSKLTSKKDLDEEEDADEDLESAYLQKFRMSADFISRIMAPSVLDQLAIGESKDKEKFVLHEGQQYISFADSRQLAAKATLKQNLEQERMWFYSTIYHELCRRKANQPAIEEKIKDLRAKLRSDDTDEDEFDLITTQVKKLRKKIKGYMEWKEIVDLLKKDKYTSVFCSLFIKRSGDSEELENGKIKPAMIEKYIYSIMVMYLAYRPTTAAAPETMGLFLPHYPQLEKIELPNAVLRFNELLKEETNKITKEDWHDLIQVFIDYHVRSNQSIYLKIADDNPLDIFACERFATEKPRRRPVVKPKFEQSKTNRTRVVRMLCGLLVRDDKSLKLSDAQRIHFSAISDVLDALWLDLTDTNNKLLDLSVHWDAEARCFVRDRDDALRFNIINMCFKLYDDMYLCDVNSSNTVRPAKCLRPIENNFKGFAPYLVGHNPVDLKPEWHQKKDGPTIENYPFFEGCGEEVTREKVTEWAKKHRSLLWENKLWGEEGVFSDRLENIHLMPNLFIQAEHTAQVDKVVSREVQNDFKDHCINILACSTTMEMGVDLGNLEVVMLTSVPPQPSNYKQRAGRSGRNNKVSSACITLCGSDAIGLRTLFNPVESIISRPVNVPMVDLMSPQVVQRHANSYLIRAFGVFRDGDDGGKLTQTVSNYYTTYVLRNVEGRLKVYDAENNEKGPKDGLGDEAGSMYEQFNIQCSLRLDDLVRKELQQLLKDTCFDGHEDYVVQQARANNERCYQELSMKLEDYRLAASGDVSDKFLTKLNMQYLEVLNNRLLNYWATSRFTPNANMPVNVLTLDLNTTGKKDFFTPSTSSNPSYGLREAISQYAPGNNIVVDGVAYIVRGIEFANMYQGVRTFKQIYRNSEVCVVNDALLSDKRRWDVNDKEGLELIQPVGFIPDMNEEKSRIMETNKFTRVSAQLIDTNDWKNTVAEPHLFSVRSNRDTGNAKILYYNEGIGYGYCFCSRCGRMVLETEVADKDDVLNKLPQDYNPRRHKNPDKPMFHYAIAGKDLRKHCGGSNNKDVVKRNVIIGDLVLTDYAEIRIRHKGKKYWIKSRSDEESLLFTLGIVFTQSLADILGKERGAVDFAIMPNGHICIFDTNPGGAGYANQMASIPLMKDVIQASKALLENAKVKKSKDMLLDKFTLRFMRYVDIDAALSWIKEEEEACEHLPEPINSLFPLASETSIVNLERAFAASSQESVLFVNYDKNCWDYEGVENGWRNKFLNYFISRGSMVTFCVFTNGDTMPEPILNMLRGIKGWSKYLKQLSNPYGNNEIYPLAYVDGILYFTNDQEYSALNSRWGNGTMYCARIDNIVSGAKSIDTSYRDSTKMFKLEGDTNVTIRSNELGGIIQAHSSDIVEQFIEYCKSNNRNLKITYQDEHLKSVMGMVLTIQTIEHFVKQINKDFTLEFLVERYEDRNFRGSITANLENNNSRDQMLTDLVEGWLYGIERDYGINGELIPLESKEHNKLTHWRVLTIECGGKTLEIYPDGGFANGWNLNKSIGVNPKYYKLDNTDASDKIGIYRSKDIKFDVTIV